MTKVGLYAVGTSTTLESNKSLRGNEMRMHGVGHRRRQVQLTHLLTQVELSLGMCQFSPGSSPAIACKPNASRVDEDQRRDQEICMALL